MEMYNVICRGCGHQLNFDFTSKEDGAGTMQVSRCYRCEEWERQKAKITISTSELICKLKEFGIIVVE